MHSAGKVHVEWCGRYLRFVVDSLAFEMDEKCFRFCTVFAGSLSLVLPSLVNTASFYMKALEVAATSFRSRQYCSRK
jgi:hypothetical protein